MEDKVFVSGLIFKRADNAPDFVVGNLSVKKSEFIPFLNSEQGDWVNLSIKLSKAGKYYIELDTWKPKKNEVEEKGYKTINKTPDLPEDNSELPF